LNLHSEPDSVLNQLPHARDAVSHRTDQNDAALRRLKEPFEVITITVVSRNSAMGNGRARAMPLWTSLSGGILLAVLTIAPPRPHTSSSPRIPAL
jgi:hypothetical protein